MNSLYFKNLNCQIVGEYDFKYRREVKPFKDILGHLRPDYRIVRPKASSLPRRKEYAELLAHAKPYIDMEAAPAALASRVFGEP